MSIRIQNPLIRSMLWRFLGFVSSVTGVICYALSSSFKQLFGKWNIWKILVYSVVSFSITLVVLFPKKWRLSRSFWLKAHVVFLVFMLTSLYSFFYDRAVNGKPDRLGLIAMGLFALMSFSLSRQIDIGFEVGLSDFFLASFTVQLLHIKQLLVFLAAFICYLFITIRSYLESSSVKQSKTAVKQDQYVAIDIDYKAYNRKKKLYSILEMELRAQEFDFTTDLEEKVKMVISAGVDEFLKAYTTWRSQTLQDNLKTRSMENPSFDEIERWKEDSNYTIKKLFPNEWRLCNQVFLGLGSSASADLCFEEICRGPTIQLLDFAKMKAINFRPLIFFAEMINLFMMFKTMTDLLPEYELVFSKNCPFLLNEAIQTWSKLREAIRGIFIGLEDQIGWIKESDDPGNTLCITDSIMSKLQRACEFRETIEQAYGENDGVPLKDYPKLHDRVPLSSSLTVKVFKLVELLESNLEARHRLMEPTLQSIAMINNRTCLVHYAEEGELRSLLGENWIQTQKSKIRECFENYKSSWHHVISILKPDDSSREETESETEYLKKKLSLFNSKFEEKCLEQSDWVIFLGLIEQEIKCWLLKIMWPAYKDFTIRFQNVLETSSQLMDTEIYSDFGVQDIMARIMNLFRGSRPLYFGYGPRMVPSIVCKEVSRTWTIISPTTKDYYEWTHVKQTIPNSKYQRCHYWNDQRCRAIKETKQIQENPPMHHIRYTNIHTCNRKQPLKTSQTLTQADKWQAFLVNHPDSEILDE